LFVSGRVGCCGSECGVGCVGFVWAVGVFVLFLWLVVHGAGWLVFRCSGGFGVVGLWGCCCGVVGRCLWWGWGGGGVGV